MRFWKDASDFLAKNWTSTLSDGGKGGLSSKIEIFAKIIIPGL